MIWLQIKKKIDEEKVTVSKCEEQLKKSKISLSNFEKDKKALLRLKKKVDDFNRKISESLSEFDWILCLWTFQKTPSTSDYHATYEFFVILL